MYDILYIQWYALLPQLALTHLKTHVIDIAIFTNA